MDNQLLCPKCGYMNIDLRTYDALLMVRSDLALFTLKCPACGGNMTIMHPIPPELHDEVRYAAIEVGAGALGLSF